MNIRVTLLLSLLIAAPSIIHFSDARAACTCVCVDGLNRPLCESAADLKPLCPPRVCPREPSVGRPLDQVTEPRPRNKSCTRKYTYNRYSRRYEWRRLCDPR